MTALLAGALLAEAEGAADRQVPPPSHRATGMGSFGFGVLGFRVWGLGFRV